MSFDMSKCKPGDKLVLRNGEVVEYVHGIEPSTIYPHLIQFSDGDIGTRTNTGKLFMGDPNDNPYDVVAFLKSSATNPSEVKLHSHPTILIIGHARHGKDTFAQILADCWGFKFESSSMYCAKNVIFPRLSSKYGYKTIEQCFEDRINHRAEWKDLISEYNQEDLTKLTKAILEINNIYVGMRGLDEFQACKEQGLFDLVVWIDDSYRKAPESKDSNELTRDLADVVVWNNGDINNLTLEACKVMRFLYDKRK